LKFSYLDLTVSFLQSAKYPQVLSSLSITWISHLCWHKVIHDQGLWNVLMQNIGYKHTPLRNWDLRNFSSGIVNTFLLSFWKIFLINSKVLFLNSESAVYLQEDWTSLSSNGKAKLSAIIFQMDTFSPLTLFECKYTRSWWYPLKNISDWDS
jgi:hypothetical protein